MGVILSTLVATIISSLVMSIINVIPQDVISAFNGSSKFVFIKDVFFVLAFSENRLSDKGAGDLYRVVTYVWILFGLSYLSLIISYITDAFVRKAEEVEQLTKDFSKDMLEVSLADQKALKTKFQLYFLNPQDINITKFDGNKKNSRPTWS